MQEQSLEVSVSPSFNSYSSDKLVDTAAKVCREFDNLDLETSEKFHGDDDFEFVSIFEAGDEVSVNGQVGKIFPVFNRDLLLLDGGLDREPDDDHEDEESVAGKPSSLSSSEADELERVPPGTYCVWTRKPSVPESQGQCKKSKSTGSSSKRWRLRDLLRRCNSDGKDSFVFLTPLSGSKKMEEKLNIKEKKSSSSSAAHKVVKKIAGGKVKAKGTPEKITTAHEAFYVRNRKLKEGEKRKSYLPYKQDLVGFFANVNAMGRSFPPF